MVHTKIHTWTTLFPYKRSLQPIGQSSFTLLGWFRLTAASRRSLDRVSVPMWGTFLSEPLSIEGLVGRYPANNLMERIPIDDRNSLIVLPCGRTMPSGINLSFERLSPSHRQVGYVLLTRAPVAIKLSKLSSCCPSTCMC